MTSIKKPAAAKNAFTAAQIEQGKLDDLGKRIEAHLEKMRGYEAKAQEKAGVELRMADNHWNSITQQIAEAKAKCDRGGFNAFQKKYCPDLGRSRIYELLAIGDGKKTVEELRAEKRASVAKSRGKVSTTTPVVDSAVTDEPEPERPPVTNPPAITPASEATPPLEPPPGKPASKPKSTPTPSVAEQPSAPPPPKPRGDGHDAAMAANTINRKLMSFHTAFDPQLKAWLKTGPTVEGLEMMHNALNLVAEELYRMAGDVRDALSALSVSKKAELDNAIPAEVAGEAMKAKFAAGEAS